MNDPRWQAAHDARLTTRVDALRVGTVALDSQGRRVRYHRRDGALSGVHHFVDPDDPSISMSCYAGCADMLVLEGSTDVPGKTRLPLEELRATYLFVTALLRG